MTTIQQFWFSPLMRKQWFGCPPETDTLIYNMYHNVIENPGCMHFLDAIILHDQISRHIYRSEGMGDKVDVASYRLGAYANPDKIAEHDQIARKVLEDNLDKLDELGPEQRCFALMPWRHTFKPELLRRCLHMVEQWNAEQPHPFYKRFTQATLKALANHSTLISGHWTIQNPEVFASILDSRSAPVPTMKPIILPNEPLLRTFTIGTLINNKVVVSVSGGVDSMVCLFIANAVFGNKNVRCVSIDYANRPEQSLEIQMVNHVCGILEIEHYVRVIDEVKRPSGARVLIAQQVEPTVPPREGIVDREFYELFTRDMRFKAYKDVASDDSASASLSLPVILGHNLDDTLENVLSNIKKHKNYDNLFGMTQWSEERDVQIWRPLLEVPKSDIVDFALRYNIPFTYDSTPAWSERGQLRDHVIPALTNYIPGLLTLVNTMKHMYKQQRTACIQNIIFNDNVVQVNNPVYSLEYLQLMFKQIALHYKLPYPKNKSLNHLMEQLQQGNTSRLTVSVHYVAQLCSMEKVLKIMCMLHNV